MNKRGWELVARSLHHPTMTQLSSAQLRHELVGSHERLEHTFHVPVRFFCYPYGVYDRRVEAAVKRAGYDGALSTDYAAATPRRMYALARIHCMRRLCTSDESSGARHLRAAQASRIVLTGRHDSQGGRSMRNPVSRLRLRLVILLTVLVAAGGVFCAASPVAGASHAGLSRFIRAQMRMAHTPGLGVSVVRDGEVVWTRGYGWADIRRRRRATADTGFMLASTSKTVTATAAMQLVESGQLDLDADINDVLPFAVRNPKHPNDPITLRMLLTHTSSIRDSWATLHAVYVTGDSPLALGDFLRGYLVPGGSYWRAGDYYAAAPGTKAAYSNAAIALVGYLVEARTGMDFSAYCDGHIFSPLGMTDTSWHLAGLDTSRLATPYSYNVRTGCYQPHRQYGYPDYPDGELRTSARQLGRLLAAYTAGGTYAGASILQPTTITQMISRQIPHLDRSQGLVWIRFTMDGRRLVGHNGGDPGVSTLMAFEPRRHVGVIMLANGDCWGNRRVPAFMAIFSRLLAAAPRLMR